MPWCLLRSLLHIQRRRDLRLWSIGHHPLCLIVWQLVDVGRPRSRRVVWIAEPAFIRVRPRLEVALVHATLLFPVRRTEELLPYVVLGTVQTFALDASCTRLQAAQRSA